IVTTDNRYLIQALEFCDCLLRHQQRCLSDIADEANATVLTGAEDVIWIRKHPRQSDSSCLRIDVPIGGIEFAFFRICRSIGQNKFQYKPSFRFFSRRNRGIALHKSEVLLLTNNEIGFYGVEL